MAASFSALPSSATRDPGQLTLEDKILRLVGNSPPGGVVGNTLDLVSLQTSAAIQRIDLRNPLHVASAVGLQVCIDSMIAQGICGKTSLFNASGFGVNLEMDKSPLIAADLLS